MGAVYKRKRRACGLCKPHKRGIAPKKTDRARNEQKLAEREMKKVVHARAPAVD